MSFAHQTKLPLYSLNTRTLFYVRRKKSSEIIDEDVAPEIEESKDRAPVKPPTFFSRVFNFYSRNFIVLLVVKFVVLGCLLRFFATRGALGQIDARESLSLLMSKDFLHGHISTFRYGHNSCGTLEYFIGAIAVAIWGTTHFAARIAPLFFLALTSLVYWRAFARTPHKDNMRYVLVSLWVWPAFFVWSSTRFTGSYSATFFGEAIILATAYYAAHSLRNTRYFYAWALASGVCFWLSSLALIFIIPSAIWILLCAKPLIKKTPLALVLFILGSLPVWVYSVRHKVVPLTSLYRDSAQPVRAQSRNGQLSIAQILGDQSWFSSQFNHNLVAVFLDIIYLVATVLLIALFVMGLNKVRRVKVNDFSALLAMIFGATCIMAIIYCATSHAIRPQHLIFAIPAVSFFILTARNSRIVLCVALTAMVVASTISLVATNRDHSHSSAGLAPTVTTLNRFDVMHVLAPYDIASELDAKSGDKITVSPLEKNYFDHTRDSAVRKNTQAIVVRANDSSQQSLVACIQASLGTAFVRVQTRDTDVFLVDAKYAHDVWEKVQRCNAIAFYVENKK